MSVLDIDNNRIFFAAKKSCLCECQTTPIANKLHLAKKHFYICGDRIENIGKKYLETSVNDENFIKIAKKMHKIRNEKEKEKVFVLLIKNSFFKFFQCLKNIEECIIVNGESMVYDLNNDKFIEMASKCQKIDCVMPKF